MSAENPNPASSTAETPDAAEHVAEAHRILSDMQKGRDKHPELEEAIAKLEMALSILTTKTGGML